MRRIINILKATAFVTYKEWAAYRSHMVLSLFIGPVFFLTQIFIWKAVFTGKDVVNGFTFNQMIAYCGIIALINYVIMDFADWNLQMLIRTGRFLTFILRPISHRFFAFSQKVGHRLLGFWLEFLPVYLLFFFVFKIKLIPVYPGWFFLSLFLSFIMMFLVNYSVGILGFWLTRTEGVRRMFLIFRDISAGVFIPLTFFPAAVQNILFFLPFQFISYVPVSVFIGKYAMGGLSLSIPAVVAVQALAVLIMLGMTEVLWRMGIKRFTGAGA